MNAGEDVRQDGSQMTVEEYVVTLLGINNGNRFELWKHFEDNARNLQSTLWDQGKWLLAIQGGVLFLPFTAELIEPTTSLPFLVTGNLLLVILMYLFGIALSMYSLAFQDQVGEHIARNFDRAYCALHNAMREPAGPRRISILRQTTCCLLVAFLIVPIILTLGELLTRP
jgi:hypothetical protein